MTALDVQIKRIAQTPRLLVACDYDGVVAPIVANPNDARPLPEIVECLDRFAALRQTDVAIVSGRTIESLQRFLGECLSWHLVGCHGAQWAEKRWAIAGDTSSDELMHFADGLNELAAAVPGCTIEVKPYGVAFHYRNADPAQAEAVIPRALALAEGRPGVFVRRGKMVVEFSITTANKGDAIKRLRYLTGASATLFAGDDVTDEDAFLTLGEADIGISVGGLRQGAAFDVPDVHGLRDLLGALLDARIAWETATRPIGIERHTLLSDQRSIALLDEAGTIDWMCMPRLDSPPICGALMGRRSLTTPGESLSAGYFTIAPAEPDGLPRQTYVGDSMVAQTHWRSMTVTDYLDCSNGRPYQRAGSSELVRVIEGRGRVRVEFAPRFDFGRTVTTIAANPDGLVIEGHLDPVTLYARGIDWTIEADGPHSKAIAEFDLPRRSAVVMELRYGSANLRPSMLSEPQRRAQAIKFWSAWASSLRLPSVEPEAVRRSALTIKALAYGPSGAIIAAPTTSLPEWLGGGRNWDYRYCWPRDAALAGAALVRLGNTGHGMRLLDWLLGIVDHAQSPERLRPIYTVTGHELGPEAEISEISGFALSRPVRVSNAASQQVQLDVFGPIVDLALALARAGAPLSPDHWRLVEAMVLAVERRWQEPDNGIWEIRGPRRHYVHSKLMCWLAVDRAIRLADQFRGGHPPAWDGLVDSIRDEALAHGWDETLGGFRLAYDVSELDAASVLVGLQGLIPLTDERFVRTVESVDRLLRVNSAVYRYRFDDGLPGREGGMLICLGWLIEAYVALGHRTKAEDLFERLMACAGHTGLLAEQVDAVTGNALGNFPQVYSHLALINAAVALDRRFPRD